MVDSGWIYGGKWWISDRLSKIHTVDITVLEKSGRWFMRLNKNSHNSTQKYTFYYFDTHATLRSGATIGSRGSVNHTLVHLLSLLKPFPTLDSALQTCKFTATPMFIYVCDQ